MKTIHTVKITEQKLSYLTVPGGPVHPEHGSLVVWKTVQTSQNQIVTKGKQMNYRLIIKADYNDGDYVTSVEKINQETLDNVIKPVVSALSVCTKNYNWHNLEDYQDILTEEQIEIFEELRPYATNGIHTIEKISITPWVEEEILFV